MNILDDEKEYARLSPPQREERKTLWDFYFKLLIYFDIHWLSKMQNKKPVAGAVMGRWRRDGGKDGVCPAPPLPV